LYQYGWRRKSASAHGHLSYGSAGGGGVLPVAHVPAHVPGSAAAYMTVMVPMATGSSGSGTAADPPTGGGSDREVAKYFRVSRMSVNRWRRALASRSSAQPLTTSDKDHQPPLAT
jgi:hypothetical protein